MTNDEALKLKRGDRVWIIPTNRSKGNRIEAVVLSVTPMKIHLDLEARVDIAMRPLGLTSNGRTRPAINRWHYEVTLKQKHDPTTANVFADYLDEHGYSEAAQVLRKKFPIYTTGRQTYGDVT